LHVFRNPSSGRERPWELHHLGRRLTLQPKVRYVVDEGEGLVSAAAAGLGLIQVPDYMAAVALRERRLKETLAQFRLAPMPISLVCASRLRAPVRLRALIDALCRRAPAAAAASDFKCLPGSSSVRRQPRARRNFLSSEFQAHVGDRVFDRRLLRLVTFGAYSP
jgi:LysR substrate binding domain